MTEAGDFSTRQGGAGAALSTSLGRGGPSLRVQVVWFNRLRFLAVSGMALATFAASPVGFEVLREPLPLYALCATTLLLNGAYVAWFRRRATPQRDLRRHVLFQIGVDLIVLTLVLHFSGGVSNPIVLFYVFHTFIASLLLSARVALLVAALSVLLIAGLGYGEHFGWWPPYQKISVGLFGAGRPWAGALAVWVATLAVVLAVSVYFVSTILARLRASEREVRGLSRQLALSEKLASIGTLAAGVSHEINNPVSVIGHKSEILRYRIADGDTKGALFGEIDTIDRHLGRIRAITEGLLVFSRETPFELQQLSLGDVARDAVDLARVSFEHAGVSIELVGDAAREGRDARLRVAGSANHLMQVFVNMLLNARDASEPGASVIVDIVSSASEVGVRIADQGQGIAPELVDKIFDPFFTTKDVDKGTGLGLALSHGLVERHGGRIEVQSEVGRGSVFTVWLPRA